MRRVSSTQQNRNSAVAVDISEQCMQRQPSRTSSATPSRSPGLHHTPRWFLLLAASLIGFSFLLVLWTYLPPSTVLGVTAQAQAQQHQYTREARTKASDSSTALRAGSTPPDPRSAASEPHPGLAAGSSLYIQALQQLQQQKEHQRHLSPSSAAGRASLRGSASSSAPSSAAMSTNGNHQQHSAPAVPSSARVIVVGGGLAGLTAALQAAECLAGATKGGGGGCPAVLCSSSAAAAVATAPAEVDVLVVEKMPRLGGNSAKASSGINALNPGAGDSETMFAEDVLTSGGGASSPQLVEQLVRSSSEAMSFLAAHGVALTGVTRLGGHAVPRTRTVTGGANVGWVIMSALIAAVKENPRIRVLEGYSLKGILTTVSSGTAVRGVELAAVGPDGASPLAAGSVATAGAGAGAAAVVSSVSCGAVVLATGGFAANRELLQSVAPAAAELATTNGPWARGDALKLAAATGASLVGMSDVQVHPTGFVDPADPRAGTKFLAPEKLRGVGGVLLNSQGHRFVDELARRDLVSAAMMALTPDRTAWLLLGRDAGAEYGSGALDFYCKKGLMHKAETLAAAAAVMGISEDRLRAELMAYGSTAAATGKGGSPDPYGKRVFPHPPDPDSQLPMYLARVTPVVHYTMGGVAINERAEVLREGGGGAVIKGLYAAGEVSGGLHGRNRLGGNSLLECAVFGRIAGAQAARCSASR